MSIAENESERYVRNCLESLGFAVERLPESDEPRADFRAVRDGVPHVIEVKSRGGDAGMKNADGIEVRPVARTNSISGVIVDADLQLRSTAASSDEFRIAWIDCVGDAVEVHSDQAIRAFYGLETVNLFDARMSPLGERGCLYFSHNDFFRCRDIDAAVVSGEDKWAMFLNEFSPRFERIHTSPLRAAFDLVFDPRALVADGKMLSCNGSNIDRRVESEVQRFLRAKYGLGGISRTVEIDCRARVQLPPVQADDSTDRCP